MDEFIKKLIERLEEEHERCINRYGIVGGNAPAMEVKQCIDIVNELAEECSSTVSKMENNGWIACSEKLPVYLDNVLVCTKSGGRTIACIRNSLIEWVDMYATKIDNVIAWQPLPAPYRLKGNETVTNCNALNMETADNEHV